MSKRSQEMAHDKSRPLVQAALEGMRSQQDREISRLLALQKKNPSIRDAEITFLRFQSEQLETYIQESQTQLEGLRVIIAT